MSKTVDLRIGNREMLHNKVCTVLRKAILKGDLKPGERLVQTELAEQIGVSRMPVREALRTLEIEGLVTMEPHKGAIVRTISKEDIVEIYELRAILEPMALKKGIPNFTEEDLENLKKYHQQMVETDSDEVYTELNAKFHKLLFSRTQSPRLLGFIETISLGFAQDTPLIITGQIKKSNQEHEQILQSILNQNIEQAGNHLAHHISRTGEELITSLDK
ncbi:GntR family transcriptional regulator [Salinibacillus xinjiangensis]|uniref:FCD domain-containing protein n=1 Tax=Salinibacillus xinjiangensis TaxID=1229268 RepID=A0A6G1X1L2_9BACI|nr:GntR family transcriptional regulator [Salinibacillus xinjiangensis]MRG84832.1 FCD domain-containing protein [Salinibacillus xinjiangensis]